MSDALPKGWVLAKLTDVVSFALGGDWGKDPGELTDGLVRVRVVRGTEFKNWRKDKGLSAAERCIKISSLEKRRLQKNDLVLEVSGGGPQQPVGRTVLIDDEALKRADAPLVCSNFFRMLRLHDEIDVSFISHFLDYAYLLGKFNEFQTETTNLRNLNVPDFLAQTNVPLAPLAEQKRIVTKLEAVLEKVDACRARLDKIPMLLKRFRQSVLAAACSGNLTADWREEKLMEDWPEMVFGDVIESSFYGPRFGADDYSDEGIPTIRTTDMDFRGGLNLDNSPRIKLSQEQLARLGLQDGDLLVTRTGATIGKCALYTVSLGPALPSAYLIRFRLNKTLIEPSFALLFLLSPAGQAQLLGGSTAVAQPNVNAKAISGFSILLPSLSEQQEIVKRVEKLFALADRLEARYTKAKAQVDRLTQSILAKAFRGELVPQDPNDEPASALLARIQSERKKPTSGKPARKSRNAR